MKKIVATFLMMVCFGHCYAQDAANLVEKVDSLEQEVRCLNANITFIRCHYGLEIFRLESDIILLELEDALDELGDVLAGRNTAITYESQKESNELYKERYSYFKEDYDFFKKEVASCQGLKFFPARSQNKYKRQDKAQLFRLWLLMTGKYKEELIWQKILPPFGARPLFTILIRSCIARITTDIPIKRRSSPSIRTTI